MTYPAGTAAQAIEIAKAEIGYVEVPDNKTKFGAFMKADGLPWCGSFCNWVLSHAGVKVHSVVGTAVGAHKFKEISRWHDIPLPGDLAFMDFPHDGVDRISHVGIVVEVKGKTIIMLINDPAILFADEPTGNLDSKNGEVIINLLLDLAKADGRTLVVVTHDENLASRGDRLVRIVDGCLATN